MDPAPHGWWGGWICLIAIFCRRSCFVAARCRSGARCAAASVQSAPEDNAAVVGLLLALTPVATKI
jgi:hypothetical protein